MNKQIQQLVQSNERVDSFLNGKVQVIQSDDYFSLSIDALLLANFIEIPQQRRFKYIDFCTGNGVIPLILSQRTSQKLQGIEIQAGLVDMAKRSALINQCSNQLEFIHQDLNDFNPSAEDLYDIVSCNPPYFLVDSTNAIHHLSAFALARHEISLTLEQWIKKAAQVMRDRGKLFLVHRPERLDDLFELLLQYNFSILRLRFIQPKPNSNANGVLIEARYRGGRRGVKVEPAIIVYNGDGTYTDEVKAIYYAG